ncbi:hypothetical protein HPB51_015538 [Rhipicephalus microplus]|uniref:Tetratricopeptide repeat protein 30 n=1 Tax=Rhipicephalus microplus TaxID=6941 RepID=A0A9J6EH40_RHIMP|nr:hypothetical protein HPB51_015538 [Rhipicephalus microplus]
MYRTPPSSREPSPRRGEDTDANQEQRTSRRQQGPPPEYGLLQDKARKTKSGQPHGADHSARLAVPKSAAVVRFPDMASWARPIRDGEYTSVIYGLIREGRLIEAASALADCSRRQGALGSRAALSLLAFCHYQAQEFEQAASCYEQLCTLCPEEPRYALSRAQALYQSGQAYDEALQVAAALAEDKPEMAPAARQLQAAIRYAQVKSS